MVERRSRPPRAGPGDRRAPRSARPPDRRPASPRRARRPWTPSASRTGATCASRAPSASTMRGARRPVSRISRGAGTLIVSARAALAAPSSKASHPSGESSTPRAAAEHRPLRERGADQVRHLRVHRAAARAPIGPAEPPSPSTIRPPSTASAALKAPPSSSITNEVVDEVHAEPVRLLGDPQRDARDLVRGPQVDAIPLSIRRDRRQMDRAGAEHERQSRCHQRAHDRAHPADADAAMRLVRAHQEHECEFALADLRRPERAGARSRPGRARPRTGRARSASRPAAPDRRRRRRSDAALEHDVAGVEHAHVERDRARVDAGDADGAQTSSLAIA